MNQFSKKDKEHIRSYHAIPYKELLREGTKESDISHKLYKQMRDFNEDFTYWKERFSQINTKLIYFKSLKTNLYKMIDTKEKVYIDWSDWEAKVQEINEKLFWWRNYYSKAKPIYDDVKHDALHAHAYYLHFLQDKNSKRLEAKNFKGKHLYKVCIEGKNGCRDTYYVRSDSEYLDENNFKDEFRDGVESAVSRFGKDLEEFSWNASWHLSSLFKFYDDLKIKIYELDSTCSILISDLLIDFSEFRAWRKNSISEAHRVTFDDFIKRLQKEKIATADLGEFRSYMAEHLEESPENISVIRKTIHYWNKFYNMFENGEWPQDRSNENANECLRDFCIRPKLKVVEGQTKGINRSCSKIHQAFEGLKKEMTDLYHEKDKEFKLVEEILEAKPFANWTLEVTAERPKDCTNCADNLDC